MGVVQEYLNYLQECEGTDAADENEIVNGGDPESSLDAKDNIEDELLENLDIYCKKAGYTRNEMILLMISHCLEEAVIYEDK